MSPKRFPLVLSWDIARAVSCIAGVLGVKIVPPPSSSNSVNSPTWVLPALRPGRQPQPQGFPVPPIPAPGLQVLVISVPLKVGSQTRPDQTATLQGPCPLVSPFVALDQGNKLPQRNSCRGSLGPKAMMREEVGVETTLFQKMHWEVRTPGGSERRWEVQNPQPPLLWAHHRRLSEGVASAEGGGEIVERGFLQGSEGSQWAELSEGNEGSVNGGAHPWGVHPCEDVGLSISNEGDNYRSFFFPNVGGSVLQPGPFSAHPPHPSLRPQASAWAAVSGGGEV